MTDSYSVALWHNGRVSDLFNREWHMAYQRVPL